MSKTHNKSKRKPSTADNLEKRVYNSYRNVYTDLRHRPHRPSSSTHNRCGADRQKAREITADRYKLPISEVKEIVKRHDELNGVTHEAPVEPHWMTAAWKIEEMQVAIRNDANFSLEVCSMCGIPNGEKFAKSAVFLSFNYRAWFDSHGEKIEFAATCFDCDKKYHRMCADEVLDPNLSVSTPGKGRFAKHQYKRAEMVKMMRGKKWWQKVAEEVTMNRHA